MFTLYKNITLVSLPNGFHCPGNSKLIDVENYYQDYNISLGHNLYLVASHPSIELNTTFVIDSYNSSEFCLVYEEENMVENNQIKPDFKVCIKQHNSTLSFEFTSFLYPVALLISSLFLFITLLTYIIDWDIRRPLFGKITISFLINNCIAFLLVAVSFSSDYFENFLAINTFSCILLGYFTLYFSFSFMFWISAMTVNIYLRFSSNLYLQSNDRMIKFLPYFLYAQVIQKVSEIS